MVSISSVISGGVLGWRKRLPMASTNKCLAESNKPHTAGKATKGGERCFGTDIKHVPPC